MGTYAYYEIEDIEAFATEPRPTAMEYITHISKPSPFCAHLPSRRMFAFFFEFYLPRHWEEITDQNIIAHITSHFFHSKYRPILDKNELYLDFHLNIDMTMCAIKIVEYHRKMIEFLLNTKDVTVWQRLLTLNDGTDADEFSDFLYHLSPKYAQLLYSRMVTLYQHKNIMPSYNNLESICVSIKTPREQGHLPIW